MAYMKLNEKLKSRLLEAVQKVEVDVEDLESYHIDRNPYNVECQLAGGSSAGDWDENEEWQAKIKASIKFLKEYSACEFMELDDQAWDEKDGCDDRTITKECINFLSTLEE